MPSLASSAPHGPNGGSTAPVLEFVCLFTYDLKRKQKRWQDGRIKYHTFNKRVMVYDERGNFVGDMHWRRDWDFDEGDEVELERGGAIVQVSECVGRQDQDLSELLDKRAKEKELRAALRPSMLRPSNATPPMHRFPAPPDHLQTRHRPLHQVIGTPTGHHGRALIPSESPFEQRRRASDTPAQQDDTRPSKRRKHDSMPRSKMGYAQSLFGAPLTLSGVPVSSAPPRRPATAQQTRPDSLPQPLGVIREALYTSQDSLVEPPTPPPRIVGDRPRSTTRPEEGRRERGQGVATSLECGQGDLSVHRDGGAVLSRLGCVQMAKANDQPRLVNLHKNTQLTPLQDKGATSTIRKHKHDGGAKQTTPVPTASQRKITIILDEDEDTENVVYQSDEAVSRKKPNHPTHGARPASSKQKKSGVATQKTQTPRSSSPHRGAISGTVSTSLIDPDLEDDLPHRENRAELRLKSRQKRGLLMVSYLPKKPKHTRAGKTEKTNIGPVRDDSHVKAPLVDDIRSAQEVNWASAHDPAAELVALPKASLHQTALRNRGAVTCGETASASLAGIDPASTEGCNMAEPIYDEIGNTEGGFMNDPSQVKDPIEPAQETNLYYAAGNAEPPKFTGRSCGADDEVTESDGSSAVPYQSSSTTNRAMVKETKSRRLLETVDDAPIETASRKTRSTARPLEDSDQDLPQVPVGPRLARLSRRSVKSKEVIGFIVSSSPTPEESSPPADTGALSPAELVSAPGAFASNAVAKTANTECFFTGATGMLEMHAPAPPDARIDQSSRPVLDDAGQQSLPPENCQGLSADRIEEGLTEKTPTRNGAERRPCRPATITSGSNRAGEVFASATLAGSHRGDDELANARPPRIARMDDLAGDEKNEVHPGLRKRGDLAGHQLKKTTASHSVERGGDCNTISEVPSAVSPKKARPRIANPATRGRKAALKSHAAGQVPQSILPPPEPVMARLSLQAVPETRKDSNGNERPKRKMAFPGFTSARSGGPWSREAHDLLETGRPV